jgi:acetyl esterase
VGAPPAALHPQVAALLAVQHASVAPDLAAVADRRLDPDVSPLRASREQLAGAPAALVVVCGHDVLRAEGIAYARRLEEAGVQTELVDFPDMVHGFLRWGGVVDRARELVDLLGERARRALA